MLRHHLAAQCLDELVFRLKKAIFPVLGNLVYDTQKLDLSDSKITD